MADLAGFNANEVEPTTPFEPIPAGTYSAIITDSEMKPTKNGNGEYLQLTLQIVDGEHQGRMLWDRLNLVNQNATAVQIARATLSSICRAVGIMSPKDSTELHDRPLRVKVVQTVRRDTGETTNEVKGYEPATKTAPAAVATGGKAPWQK